MPEWQFWLVLGIIFMILEIITPTFFFFWFGLSGFITTILAIFISNKIFTSTTFIIV
jgi:membrane protein implicated in regulation of membrane protease activity